METWVYVYFPLVNVTYYVGVVVVEGREAGCAREVPGNDADHQDRRN